jgi:hypothetical protein
MTGEVAWIKPNGEDSRGDQYPTHTAVARALRCKLRPFDVYIGPYIAHKRGKLFLSAENDGFGGVACLWPGGVAPAYCEPITEAFAPYWDEGAALAAARAVLARAR